MEIQEKSLVIPPLPQNAWPASQKQPKRRRYRIPRSCDRCRASKIRCVFEDGQCTACVNARVPCTFANPGSLKERPPTQKDVEHLQARIRSLERLIHAIDPALDISSLPEPKEHQNLKSDSNPKRAVSTCSQSETSFRSFLETRASESDPVLVSLFLPSQLKLNSSAGSLPLSLGNVKSLSPVDKVFRQEFAKNFRWSHSCYPEPDLERSLLELYFRNIHPCMPLIHPATFMQDLKSGLSRRSESFRVLCFSMMAVSSRFSKDPRVFVDLDGHPQPSLHTTGIPYAMVVGSYISQPIDAPANIHDLQAILLLVIYALGNHNPDRAWDIVGFGLQRAQETGAHLEKSSNWSTCPIQDHLRRKAFTMLYEFDCLLSGALGKQPYMQESDYDVLPIDLDYEIEIGTFTNPFCTATNDGERQETRIANDLGLAYWNLKSSFEGLKKLFPLIDIMIAQRDSYPGGKFASCVELLINQVDASMTKCYEKISRKFSAQKSNNAHVTDCQLISSVTAATCYHEFRLLAHKVLFSYKGNKDTAQADTRSTPNDKDHNGQECSWKMNPHAEICVESARMIIGLIYRLHQRNLLELGFYWIPLRVTNALIILIVSLKKFRKTLTENQRQLRLSEISLGIEILNVLAPSTFLAGKCAKMMSKFQQCVLHPNNINKKKSNRTSLTAPNSSPIHPSSSSPPCDF